MGSSSEGWAAFERGKTHAIRTSIGRPSQRKCVDIKRAFHIFIVRESGDGGVVRLDGFPCNSISRLAIYSVYSGGANGKLIPFIENLEMSQLAGSWILLSNKYAVCFGFIYVGVNRSAGGSGKCADPLPVHFWQRAHLFFSSGWIERAMALFNWTSTLSRKP